ncbi:MAG: hypothetical protein AAGD01_10195 [Acidobacteriota bacterium]
MTAEQGPGHGAPSGESPAATPRFWSVDIRRLTYRELWWMSGRNPFTFGLAAFLKLIRVPLAISQLIIYPPRILKVEPGQIEPQTYRRIYDQLKLLAQQRIAFCFLYREPSVSANSRALGAAALAQDGQSLAMVADAEARSPGFRKQQTNVSLITSLADGRYFVTTNATRQLLSDASIDVDHHPRADVAQLVTLHQQRVGQLPQEAVAPLDRSWVEAVLTDLSERSFRFHSQRGFYRPAKAKEVERLRPQAVGTQEKVPARIDWRGNLLAWIVVFFVSYFAVNWFFDQPWNPLSSSARQDQLQEAEDLASEYQEELYADAPLQGFNCRQSSQAQAVADSAVLTVVAAEAAVTGMDMPGFRVLARFSSPAQANAAARDVRGALERLQMDLVESESGGLTSKDLAAEGSGFGGSGTEASQSSDASDASQREVLWLTTALGSDGDESLRLRSTALEGIPEPEQAVATLGDLVLLRSYATSSRRARPWAEGLRSLGAERVMVEHFYLDRTISVSVKSPWPKEEVLDDLRDYLEIPPHFFPRPPWAADAPLSPEARRARRTFRELSQVATDEAFEAMGGGRVGSTLWTLIRGASSEDSWEQMEEESLEKQSKAIERYASQQGDRLDPEIVQLFPRWLALASDPTMTESGFWEPAGTATPARQLALRLQPLQGERSNLTYAPENTTVRLTDPAAPLASSSGFLGRDENFLYLNGLLFADTSAGLPALLAYLCESSEAARLEYALEDFDSVRGD